MSRTIAVLNSDGEPDYVVAEPRQRQHRPQAGRAQMYEGAVEFFMSSGEGANFVKPDYFEDMDGERYQIQDVDDVEWLKSLSP